MEKEHCDSCEAEITSADQQFQETGLCNTCFDEGEVEEEEEE